MTGLAAEVVVVVHLAYLLYVPLGGFLGLRDVRWSWPHAATAVWAWWRVITQASCPLTVLEQDLILLDGGAPYAGPFIGHYLADVVYPAAWQDAVSWVRACVVLASYGIVLTRHAPHAAS